MSETEKDSSKIEGGKGGTEMPAGGVAARAAGNTASPGVLTSSDIEAEIDNNGLIRGADKGLIQACSYDMRIGTIFKDGRPITGPFSR